VQQERVIASRAHTRYRPGRKPPRPIRLEPFRSIVNSHIKSAAVRTYAPSRFLERNPTSSSTPKNRLGCLPIDVPESRSLGGRQSQSRHLEELAANTPDQWSSLVIH
jgi:hypothetical protein